MPDGEGLSWRVQQLQTELQAQEQRHRVQLETMRQKAADLRRRLQHKVDNAKTDTSLATKPATLEDATPDDTFARTVTWKIDKMAEKIASTPKNKSIWSDQFSIAGIPGMQLEFFPNGRGTTITEGFCSLFLWCPSNMQIKYQLRVGSHYAAPDEDTYNSRMGHGHSNFCLLDLEVDKDNDTLEVGCHILGFTFKEQIKGDAQCVNIIKTSAEALVAQEADVIYNRGVELVQWTIKDVLAKAKQVPRGCAICSPTFSVAGVRQMLMEFYPSGMSQQSKDGVMGLYLRCPNGTQLVVTLFAGKTEKGPLKAEFDGNTAKGMPEFCALAPEIVGDDLVVGIKVQNPRMEEQATVTELRL